ncbi:hypothetical protein Sjap_011957 [Stephania japonica]|uniref:AP2/ERF domain-containing protein n=1 Tax=Stephania japonica TaxID=461633 RepID=A0AAP0P7V6_9MAGN
MESTTTTTSGTNFESTSPSSSQQNYKGVRKRKWGKWVSEIRLPNSRERIWLGSYDTPEKAARAFDAALYCLRGSNAKFNFPENPPEITNGRSLTPSEIQDVAARFANGEMVSSREDSQPQFDSMMECPTSQSESPSFSDGGVTTQVDHVMDWAFYDMLMPSSSNASMPHYDMFSGINEFSGEFLAPEPEINYEDETSFSQGSFLWNF